MTTMTPADIDTIIYSALNPPGKACAFYRVIATTNTRIIQQICPDQLEVSLLLIFKQHDYVPVDSLTPALEQARSRAIGIASNHANLTAAQLGYSAGFSNGRDLEQEPCLMLGIGRRHRQITALESELILHQVREIKALVPILVTRLI